MSTRVPSRSLHPLTAWCRECDWRWDRHDPNPTYTEARDRAAEDHARSTGHAVAVSMPGSIGYEAIRCSRG